MEPLQMNREILKVFDLRINNIDDTPLLTKWCNRIILFIILASLTHAGSSTINFMIEIMETDLESALFAIYQVAACFSALYTAVVTSLFPEPVQIYFDKLKDTRKNCKFATFHIKNLKIQSMSFFHSCGLHQAMRTTFCSR